MGTTDDPTDGPAVATAAFGAVAVYGVCIVSPNVDGVWQQRPC